MGGALVPALLLTACAGPAQPPLQTLPPSASDVSTPKPVYATRAEAVAAAEKLYREYIKASSAMLQDGGKDVDRVKPYLSTGQFAIERGVASQFEESNRHLVGETHVRRVQVQQADLQNGQVRMYVCLDNSRTHVQSADGRDVTPKARPASGTLLVDVEEMGGGPRVSGSEVWSGEGVC